MSRRTRTILIVAVAAILAVPVVAIAADRFTDVPDSHPFHDDISWLAGAGVTLGCNPPTNDRFCPDDPVKRQQMAAFMHRFAQYLGAEDGVVSEADHAATADDADTLDGYQATDLVYASGVVDDGFLDDFVSGELISDTIDAPVDGFLYIVGSVGAEDDCSNAGPSALFVEVMVDGTAADSGLHPTDFDDCDSPDTDGDNTFNNSTAITVVVPVTAGSHTVSLDASTSGEVWVDRRAISTLFVPFGQISLITTGLTERSPSQDRANR